MRRKVKNINPLKLAIITRGVPGSGKSTFTKTLSDNAKKKRYTVDIHSTDNLCMVNGKYEFDFNKMNERHEQNYENFVKSLKLGTNIVVCDNTNVRPNNYKYYVSSAKELGYIVVAVVFKPDTLENHIIRNTHNVPKETLEKMISTLNQNMECKNVDKEYVITGKHPNFSFKEELNYIVSNILNL
jgi:predicted kinase